MKRERNKTKELHVNFKLEIDTQNCDNINNFTRTYNDTDTYTYNYSCYYNTLNFENIINQIRTIIKTLQTKINKTLKIIL